nr:sialoadhesin-like isoform X3 [Chrysemys picta bellii]XP_042702876.1 sialoadhesin-like isoform X3 [Chrysemys picta bellii]XP_042702877.1 sialoadhesin-like isoform X3 [Chrysemys picta bellii]
MEALLLLALSILTGAGCQDWGVTLPADPLAGWSGSCVTIPCSYTYPEGQLVKAVTWSRDNERIVQLTTAAGQGYDKVERAQFLGDLHHDCTLRLNPLALGDGGTYSFEFQTESQSWRSPRAVCLTVSEHPCRVKHSIDMIPGPLNLNLICSISERCASSGLHWYDGAGARILEETEAGKSNSELSMHIIWQHRGAALECRVQGYRNRCLPKRSQPPATAPPVVHVVATPGPHRSTGEPLSLTCRLDTSAYSGLDFSWYKNGERLGWTQAELAFLSVQVADGGKYQCEVHNTLGKSTSLPLSITVVCKYWVHLTPHYTLHSQGMA